MGTAHRFPITATPADELQEGLIAEQWCRRVELIRERDVLGVDAHRLREGAWPWRVTVWAMGAVRDEPLEGELRRSVAAALQSVAKVTRCIEDDREVWAVQGDPSGEALVAAVAAAVDLYADRIRTYCASGR